MQFTYYQLVLLLVLVLESWLDSCVWTKLYCISLLVWNDVRTSDVCQWSREARLKPRPNELDLLLNPRGSSEASSERAWIDVQPEKLVCISVQTRHFQKTRAKVFNLVSSGRPLVVVRTTRFQRVNFIDSCFRPDECVSRPDALNLIRVLWSKFVLLFI